MYKRSTAFFRQLNTTVFQKNILNCKQSYDEKRVIQCQINKDKFAKTLKKFFKKGR